MTATDAKNRFGQLLEMARDEPVRIQKDGRVVAVVLSIGAYEEYEAQRAQTKVRPELDKLLKESIDRRRSLYEALAK